MKRRDVFEFVLLVVLTAGGLITALGLARIGWLEPRLVFAAAGGVAILAATTLAVLARLRSRRRDPADDPCPHGGYSLRGNQSGVCPECVTRVMG